MKYMVASYIFYLSIYEHGSLKKANRPKGRDAKPLAYVRARPG